MLRPRATRVASGALLPGLESKGYGAETLDASIAMGEVSPWPAVRAAGRDDLISGRWHVLSAPDRGPCWPEGLARRVFDMASGHVVWLEDY